jgi:peptidoglycan/LPS O-acetylase OafA/YrhL
MENQANTELTERLELIESMIAEGRRSTTRWAWTIVLWGVALYVAVAWSSGLFGGPIWGRHYMAWPVTMVGAWVLNWALATRMRQSAKAPMTTVRRAIVSVWLAMGISMFALLLPLGLSGKADQQVCLAVVMTLLATANAASGILLKWKAQIACAVVWWLASAACLFGSATQSLIAFLAAIFFCQFVFGIYAMILESRAQRRQGAANA